MSRRLQIGIVASIGVLAISLFCGSPVHCDQYSPEDNADENWQTQRDANDTDARVEHADDDEAKMESEKQNLLAMQDRLEKSYDELQRSNYELNHDIDELTAKQKQVAIAMSSVLASLNDVHRRLGEF
jgi:septal ring factor EnvC (AmiA/AmiB activator)